MFRVNEHEKLWFQLLEDGSENIRLQYLQMGMQPRHRCPNLFHETWMEFLHPALVDSHLFK